MEEPGVLQCGLYWAVCCSVYFFSCYTNISWVSAWNITVALLIIVKIIFFWVSTLIATLEYAWITIWIVIAPDKLLHFCYLWYFWWKALFNFRCPRSVELDLIRYLSTLFNLISCSLYLSLSVVSELNLLSFFCEESDLLNWNKKQFDVQSYSFQILRLTAPFQDMQV